MRIYSKVAFAFFEPGKERTYKNAVEVPARGIVDVHDWVKKDRTFQNGVEAGLIEVLATREQQLKAENALAGVKTDDGAGEEAKPKAKAKRAVQKAAKAVEVGDPTPKAKAVDGVEAPGEGEAKKA